MLMLRNGRPRVLVVDDDREVRNLLCELLGEGYDCTPAASAEQALVRLEQAEFDLVLSDIQMPGMSGLEMIPYVLAKSPNTVVVMVSGMQTIESAVGAMQVGAFDYVIKPFDLAKVEAAVSRALEHHDLRVAKQCYENHLEELVRQRTAQLDGALQSLEEAYRSTLKALTAALDKRDSETSGHSERVVSFSLRLGRELGLDAEQMRSLEFGSLLHDIGKIGVPDAILRKPSRLTEEEWREMRQHPWHGRQILRGIEFLKGASRVVAQHHERWDGTGYPLGLRGEEIDINARIFAVADAFDAITSDRVYRKGRPYEAAAAELAEWSGRQFDTRVVEAFLRVPQHEWDDLRRESLRSDAGGGTKFDTEGGTKLDAAATWPTAGAEPARAPDSESGRADGLESWRARDFEQTRAGDLEPTRVSDFEQEREAASALQLT
jgi:response regulator RpfG family c-di-GMP phosphodiesterase